MWHLKEDQISFKKDFEDIILDCLIWASYVGRVEVEALKDLLTKTFVNFCHEIKKNAKSLNWLQNDYIINIAVGTTDQGYWVHNLSKPSS